MPIKFHARSEALSEKGEEGRKEGGVDGQVEASGSESGTDPAKSTPRPPSRTSPHIPQPQHIAHLANVTTRDSPQTYTTQIASLRKLNHRSFNRSRQALFKSSLHVSSARLLSTTSFSISETPSHTRTICAASPCSLPHTSRLPGPL